MKKILFVALMLLSSIAMAVTKITNDNFVKEFGTYKGPMVVEFYATWCGPCKATAPILEEAEKQLKGKIKFIKVDIDEIPDVKIEKIPTIIFMLDGKVVNMVVGQPPNAEAVVDVIKKVFKLEGK